MASLADIRTQYPQYGDMSDQALADALHAKFYSDLPKEKVYQTLGVLDQGQLDAIAQGKERAARRLAGQPVELHPHDAPEQPLPAPSMFKSVDDAVRGAADVATFGLADEISAKLGALTGIGGKEGDYEGNLTTQRARDADGGVPRLAGQVGGALLALPASATASVGRAALEGGLMGGAYGFGSGEGDFGDRMVSAGKSAFMGAAGGAAVQGVAGALANRAAQASIPTSDTLKQLGRAAYDRADAAGVILKPESVQRLANGVTADLADFGYHPALQPRVATAINELSRLSEGNVTFKGMDTARKIASAAGNSADPSERELARRVVGRIDDHMANLGPDDVLSGNASEAAEAITGARDLWSRAKKQDKVAEALLGADYRASASGSGANIDNATRQRLASLLLNKKASRGFTSGERDALVTAVKGTPTQNALRLAGKLAPTGIVSGGIGTTMGAAAGNALAGPIGGSVGAVLLPALGASAKRAADAMTSRNVERVSEVIRSGGKTAKQMVADAASGRGDPRLAALVQALMARSAAARPVAAVAPVVATGLFGLH